VLAAARDLLADGGLDGLTMRRLAQRLGVAPNAVYSHVPGKSALIDDLLDDALSAVGAPAADEADPRAGLRQMMASTYDVLLEHPSLVPLYLARQGARGPNAQALGEVMLTLLARADVDGVAAREALRVLIVYTIGFAAFATQPPTDPGEDRPLGARQLRENFTRGLDWLLAGILSG
jgi:AcrR family transcriptional regulator